MLTRKVLSIVLVAGGVVAGCTADPMGTDAPYVTGKEPVVVMGNPSCADVAELLSLDLGDFELRIDPPVTGRYLLDDVNHFYLALTDGEHADWSASIGIDAVLVKGGPGARVYLYEEATAGAGLTAPTNPANGQPYGISHVDVCWDYELAVSKTAETMLHRTWSWAIDKSAPAEALALEPGEVVRVPYTVAVSRVGAIDSDWGVAGVVTITNPAPFAATVVAITDDVGGLPVPVECARALPFTLAPYGSATCYYHAALPDGALRGNHVVVATTGPVDGGEAVALVDFATATVIERDACVEVSDDHVGWLGRVCADRTFAYDVAFGPYACGAAGTVVDTARFVTVDTGARGEDSWTVKVTVRPCEPPEQGCTRTPGYWKTHAGDMAPAFDPTWKALPEGPATPFFAAGASYLAVLRTEPLGNPYYVLAHAYIAAELNQLAGADDSAIEKVFALAGERLAELVPAKVPALPAADRALLLELAAELDAWNNGVFGPGHCE